MAKDRIIGRPGGLAAKGIDARHTGVRPGHHVARPPGAGVSRWARVIRVACGPRALGRVTVPALLLALACAAPAAASDVYVASPGTGFGLGNVSQFDVGAGGGLAAMVPATVPAGSFPAGVAASPDGQSVYVTSANFNSVLQYDVGAGGALAPKAPATVPAGSDPLAVAVSPDGQSVYVADRQSNTVSQYDVGAGGALVAKATPTVPTGGAPFGLAVSPDGQSVYVANRNSNTVSQYDVGAGGALAAKATPTVGAGNGANAVAVSPDGKSVYVANSGSPSGSVSQYDVGAGGALAPKAPATVPAGLLPLGVAVSADGQSVYVTNVSSNNVSQYDVGAGGALAPKAPATVPAGLGPHGIAVTPDGHSVYVANANAATVSQFDVGAGGALAAKAPAMVPADAGSWGLALRLGSAPVAGDDAYTTNEDTPLNVAAPGVLDNDTDADGDALTAALVSGPAHGTLTLNPNGSFSYTPAANFVGSDSFTYKANDGAVDSNIATVTLTVTALFSADLTTKAQAMDGDLKVPPGSEMQVGYSFTIPGAHAAANIGFLGATVTFNVTCTVGTPSSPTFVVPIIPDQSYPDPANSSAWYPSGDQKNASTYQGSAPVPTCSDPSGLIRLQQGGTFSATVTSDVQVPKVNIRWHYKGVTGSGGGWSGTYNVIPS